MIKIWSEQNILLFKDELVSTFFCTDISSYLLTIDWCVCQLVTPRLSSRLKYLLLISISVTTIGQIVMEFCTHIHCPQMNPIGFGGLPTSALVPPAGHGFHLSLKISTCLNFVWHSWFPDDES